MYIIGEVGIKEELDLVGVPYIGAEEFKGMEPDMGKVSEGGRRRRRLGVRS